jgi:hypothetical protein
VSVESIVFTSPFAFVKLKLPPEEDLAVTEALPVDASILKGAVISPPFGSFPCLIGAVGVVKCCEANCIVLLIGKEKVFMLDIVRISTL